MNTSTFFGNRKTVRFIFSVLCLFLLCLQTKAQDPAQYGTPFSGVPDRSDVNMYQVHIRPYSASGNLQGVIARLNDIKNLGVNVIYLMPIYPHGTSAKDSPSPYCIKDFKSIATEYGSLADLRSLVDQAHNVGMAVMLDFAVNGTSWDHPWITQHPDWYDYNGSAIRQLASFPDVADLNLNNASVKSAIIDAMRYWIFAANIDGYRCDFANDPSLSFWSDVITNLRGITSHKLLMFAEGDRKENFQAGFDLNFGDKWYYDAISPIASGASVTQIQSTTDTEYTFAANGQQVVRYTSNHDVLGSTTALQRFGGHAGVVANYLISGYMRGVPFLTSGQEVDFNQTIPWPFQSVKINWNTNPSAALDFAKINNFRSSSTAVRRGSMTNYSNTNVCAFTKINGSEKVIVMVNLRNSNSTFTIPSAFAGAYKDAYSGNSVTLASGNPQALSPFQYIVLSNVNVATVPVTGVSVSPGSVSINTGSSAQLTETVAPANASNKNVIWSSSNSYVATVSSSGVVTGVSAGTAAITVKTQDGNKTAVITVTVVTPSVTYYNIQNRWHPEFYLYDNNSGILKYGTNPGTNSSYQWERVSAGGFVLLKNRATGKYMHVENQTGSVQTGATDATWYSAQWSISATDNGWNYIINRWQTSEWVHIENLSGNAQYAGAQNGWYSAQWKFVPISSFSKMTGSSENDRLVTDLKDNNVEVYPNPVTNEGFYVKVPPSFISSNEKVLITITDSFGRTLMQGNLSSSGKINCQLPNGVYFMTISSTTKSTTQKIVFK